MRFGDFDDLPRAGNSRAIGCHLQVRSAVGLRQSISVAADQDELPAGFGQAIGDRSAESSGCTGEQCYFFHDLS